jgi:hypothetical protein
MEVTGPEAEGLATAALEWLLGQALVRDQALEWTGGPHDEEPDPTLYSGTAGIVLALLEGYRHFGDDRYAVAVARGARTLATAATPGWKLSSLYFGLTGLAFALRATQELLGEQAAGEAAARALEIVRSRFDGERWADQFELLGGNAGIGLGAARAGDLDLAVLAVAPYLRTAEPTASGVNWEVRSGMAGRAHHVAHGTLGIVCALAEIGRLTGRADFTDLALAGAADVVARNEDGPDGFLVPHSDPPYKPELNPRYSYGWCNGPAGDAQVFRLLGQVTGDPVWRELADRCWHTVTTSGLPARLRPGFWDNNGRCCGTAGVLALANDRAVEQGDGAGFARVLVADLASRAVADEAGARWSNYEHRATPSTLSPRTGWAMGNAGIVRELLRYARIATGRRDQGYAVQWPDHPAAVPGG